MKRVLSMFLAMVMVLSLVPAVGAATGSVQGEGGTIYGSPEAAQTYKDVRILIQEESKGPYKVGSLIKYLVTFKNVGGNSLEVKSIKIHNYNTPEELSEKFPGVTVPETNNVQYSIIAYDSENDVKKEGTINNLNYKAGNESERMMQESDYKSAEKRPDHNQVVFANDNSSTRISIASGASFSFYMEFKVMENDIKTGPSEKQPTLKNFLAFFIDGSDSQNAVGAYIESHADRLSNGKTGSLQIKNTVDGTDQEFNYKVSVEDAEYKGTAVTSIDEETVTFCPADDGKTSTAVVSLKNGETITFSGLQDATQFEIVQTEATGYVTKSGAGTTEPVESELESGLTVSGEITAAAEGTTIYASFFNTIAAAPPATGTTYHLNLPEGVRTKGVTDVENYKTDGKFKDFTYHSDSDRVLDLYEIPGFANGGITIEGDKSDFDPDNDFASYYQGYLGSESGDGRYYFVGWSKTPGATFNAGGGVNYRDIDYPVVEITGSGTDTLGERNIYSHVQGSHKKGEALFSYEALQGDLYAVWTKISNAGLMGYAMTRLGGDFAGAANKDDMAGWKTADDQKLGYGGQGSSEAWYKYVVLDGGYHTGDTFTVTTEKPVCTETDSSNSKGTYFAVWKVKNANKGDDQNKNYIVAPGQKVKYSGTTVVYSLDAVWATITAPEKQIVGYNGGTQSPDMTGLTTEFTGNSGTGFSTLLANATGGKGTSYLTYRYEAHRKDESAGGQSSAVPSFTAPGVYEYTVTAYLNVSDPSLGSETGTKQPINDLEIGSVKFLFVIQPRLTIDVTKALTGRDWKTGDSFSFAVTADGGVSVKGGTIAINGKDEKGTATVDFLGVTGPGDVTVTVKETVPTPRETGMTYAAEQTVRVHAAVDSDGYITLSDAGGTVTAAIGGDGNASAGVEMTNAYNTGVLVVTSALKVPSGSAVKEQTFHYTVTLTDKSFSGTVGGVEFTNGVAKFDLTPPAGTGGTVGAAVSKTFPGLPAGVGYTVAQTDEAGFTTTTSGVTGTIPASGSVTAAFVNTMVDRGSLVVKKVVAGDVPDSEKDKAFEFTIKLYYDAAHEHQAEDIDGEHGDFDFADGVASFALKNGDSKMGQGEVPSSGGGYGALYYVIEEKTDSNYTVKSETTDKATGDGYLSGGAVVSGRFTSASSATEVTFTNTRKAGSLTVSKTVTSGVKSDEQTDFNFTVTLDEPFNNDDFTNGVASFTLRDGQKKTFDLPAGVTYTVTEAEAAGFTTTSDGETGAITEGGSATATFTNTRKTGSLEITKKVDGGSVNQTFTFTVTPIKGTEMAATGVSGTGVTANTNNYTATVTITDGSTGSVTITGLPAGTYQVVEDASGLPAGLYTAAYSGNANTTGVEVTEGAAAKVTVTNTVRTGELTISKTVEGATDSSTEFTFTVMLTAPDGMTLGGPFTYTGSQSGSVTSGGIVTLKSGEYITIAGLPAGTEYKVTEAENGSFTSKPESGCSGTIVGGATAQAAFTNTLKTGSLTITKVVEGVKASQAFTFTITPQEGTYTAGTPNVKGAVFDAVNKRYTATINYNSDDPGSQSVTITGLPVGAYQVVEDTSGISGLYTTAYSGSADTTGVEVTESGTAEVTVTNTAKTGTLEVKKAELGHDSSVTPPENPTFRFTVTFTELPAGVTGFTVDGNSITAAANTVTFELKPNGNKTLSGIPVGTKYTVSEEFQGETGSLHFTTEWTGQTGTIGEGTGGSSVTCTNTYHMLESGHGMLVIKKSVVGKPTATQYQFKVTFTDGSGKPMSGTIGGQKLDGNGAALYTMEDAGNRTLLIEVPAGTHYMVREVFGDSSPDRITAEMANGEAGDSASGETASGAISEEFNYDTVTFTNYYLGDLKISKTVEGVTTEDKFTFTVTLPAGTYSYDYDGSGSGSISSGGTVTLGNGESVTIHGIPAGAAYAVTETGSDNYTVEPTGASGTINEKTVEAKFVNTRKTGGLTVSKRVSGRLGALEDLDFHFTVTLGGDGVSVSGNHGGVNFTNGVGHFTLKGGASKTFNDLPAGVTYTVTEDEANQEGYATTSTGAKGEIGVGTTATAAFINDKRDTGSLIIKKTVAGEVPDSERGKEYSFTITLYKDSALSEKAEITGEHGGLTFVSGTAQFTLSDGGSITAVGEVTEAEEHLYYKIEETGAGNYNVTSTTSDAKGSAEGAVVTGEFTQDSANTEVVFTNQYKTGSLTVSKTVTGDLGDKSKEFHFTVTLDGASINGDHDGVTFENGVATFSLKDGQSKTITGLPMGVTYTVVETEAGEDGYTTTSTGETGTIPDGTSASAAFTNRKQSSGGGGGSPRPPVTVDDREHYAYIIGVPSGEVLPDGDITRAEIATIIFRLLKDEVRARYWSKTNTFPDVAAVSWYNNAISTLQKMGAVEGEGDGRFHPEDPITRAEVATMLVRLYDDLKLDGKSAASFTDVDPDAWYAKYVAAAEELGLVIGDDTGVFRPDDSLTRAEAMTIFNRLLDRHPHKDHLLPEAQMITWPDNRNVNVWYYADVQEATNSHTCDIDGAVEDGKTYEQWQAPLPVRDWAALERAWSDAYSGSDGHDVD